MVTGYQFRIQNSKLRISQVVGEGVLPGAEGDASLCADGVQQGGVGRGVGGAVEVGEGGGGDGDVGAVGEAHNFGGVFVAGAFAFVYEVVDAVSLSKCQLQEGFSEVFGVGGGGYLVGYDSEFAVCVSCPDDLVDEAVAVLAVEP